MTAHTLSVEEAYRRLGLPADAGLAAAKSAFRARVKHLHPDTAPSSPDSLKALAGVVAAIRTIEAAGGARLVLEISAREAASGVTRTLRAGGKPVLVRVPAGARQGDQLTVVGEAEMTVSLQVRPASETADIDPVDQEALDEFIEEFSRPSAAARFARWIRRSAA